MTDFIDPDTEEARQQCAQELPAAPPVQEEVHERPEAPATDVAADSPERLATQFARLPEAERSALILFYLYLFDPLELAEVLEIPLAKLGPLLTRGRELLGQQAAGLN